MTPLTLCRFTHLRRVLIVLAPAVLLAACASQQDLDKTKAVADQALSTANSAKSDAAKALDAANHAQTTADEALKAAQQAEADAQAAKAEADKMFQQSLKK